MQYQHLNTQTLMNCVSVLCKVVVIGITRKMSSYSYEDAIRKLNSLQSNKATVNQIRKDISNGKSCTNIDDMKSYLSRTGITMSMLDELSVIHVAGTKGKGSTSAMCESILRHHGFRTGFYSSPHLVAVRERIRLEGRVVDKDHFTKHFHCVFDVLHKTQAYEGDMPKYFAFMTVLAFNMFLKEKVDVAIIEVGIGGIVDYTNVLRKVPVVGITALGIDHTMLLGNTLPQIAAAKAGIMKEGCVAYTVQQPEEAMNVLRQCASNTKCSLHVVPEFSSYNFSHNAIKESPYNLEAYQMNASLAIQLSHAWLHQVKNNIVNRKKMAVSQTNETTEKLNGHKEFSQDPYNCDKVNGNVSEAIITTIPKETNLGLRECKWPGRYQIIQTDYAQFYLDGAHTGESMEICAKWFLENNRFRDKVLIFSATGNRDAHILLNPLKEINFEATFFVIPSAYKETNVTNDNYSVNEQEEAITTCKNNSRIWREICKYPNENSIEDCVSQALSKIKQKYCLVEKSILITGSLHLVGAALSLLDPDLRQD